MTGNVHPYCAVWMLLICAAGWAVEPFSVGTGEPNDPYHIENATQLMAIGEDPNLAYKHFIIVNDIDMLEVWPRNTIPHFYGVLDGQDHVIRNLTVTGEQSGLF